MSDPTTNPEWLAWPLSEKLVQLAAYHCDELKVQEVPHGSNRGPWVDKYLISAGLDPKGESYPWCAAFVTYLLKQCGYPKFPYRPASVASWAMWARQQSKVAKYPARGSLFFILHGTTGHTGICLSELDGDQNFRTIEGNSNDVGSREGYEVCRRARSLDSVSGFIKL